MLIWANLAMSKQALARSDLLLAVLSTTLQPTGQQNSCLSAVWALPFIAAKCRGVPQFLGWSHRIVVAYTYARFLVSMRKAKSYNPTEFASDALD